MIGDIGVSRLILERQQIYQREFKQTGCNNCGVYLAPKEDRYVCKKCYLSRHTRKWKLSKEKALELEKAIMEIMEEE